MTRLRLLLSYDGSPFKGWQKQTKTPSTIQNHLEQALFQIFNQNISTIGAGRTDTGVHALAQTAHFDIQKIKAPLSLIPSLNALTPSAISCHQLWRTPSDFHAQRSAQHRTYTYLILNTKTPSALRAHHVWWYPHSIFYENLNKMAKNLLGEKDFKSFQNSGSIVQSTKRKIYQAEWFWIQPQLLAFQICGKSFLKQMVRNLVGTQLHLMKEKTCVQQFQHILDSKDRKQAGPTAPAQGLFLQRISYPLSLDKKCQKL